MLTSSNHEQEDLYDEDIHVKEAATGRISQLFLSFDAVDQLCTHPSLLPALARHARMLPTEFA